VGESKDEERKKKQACSAETAGKLRLGRIRE
jgi:hypothetical protein